MTAPNVCGNAYSRSLFDENRGERGSREMLVIFVVHFGTDKFDALKLLPRPRRGASVALWQKRPARRKARSVGRGGQ